MKISLFILAFLSVFICCISDLCKRNQRIFIVIALDGFKNSYFNETPFLKKFRDTGAYTEYLSTNRLENALSSLHSVATGYVPHFHGVLGHKTEGMDKKINTNHRKTFEYGADLYDFRDFTLGPGDIHILGPEVIPIWTLNELHGGISACMMWPGSEFPYGKKKKNCVYTMPYKGNQNMKLEDRLKKVFGWLNQSAGQPNLVMIYIEQPDLKAHINGLPGGDNTKVVNELKQINDDLEKFINKLDTELNLYKRKNIVFLSDHGMKNVVYKNLINLNRHKTVTCADTSIHLCGKMDHILSANKLEIWSPNYNTGKNCSCAQQIFSTYIRREIPSDMEYLNSQRLADIVAVMPPETGILEFFQPKYTSRRPGFTENSLFGTHGHEPDNDAIFMAKGPAFNTGIFSPFYMVDFYSLLAKLMKIEGDYNKDGQFSRVKPLIKIRKSGDNRPPINWIFRFMIIYALAIIHCGTIYHYGNAREKQRKRRAMERRERRERKKSAKMEKQKRQTDSKASNT